MGVSSLLLSRGVGSGSVPDDGVGLGNVVALLVDGGVTVGVPDGGEAWKGPALVSQGTMTLSGRSIAVCTIPCNQTNGGEWSNLPGRMWYRLAAFIRSTSESR